MMNFILFLIGIFAIIILVYFVKKRCEKKFVEFKEKLRKEINFIGNKFYININNEEFTNLDAKLIVEIKKKFKENFYEYENQYIYKNDNSFYFETKCYLDDIDQIKYNLKMLEDENRKIKDKEYYFYKEFISKLDYLLKEIDLIEEDILQNEMKNVKCKLKNLENKIDFLIKIFKERGNVEFKKYKLCKLKFILEKLKSEFGDKIIVNEDIEISNENIYIYVDLIYDFIKTLLYSILKNNNFQNSLEMNLTKNDEYLEFNIKNNNSIIPFKDLVDFDFLEFEDIKENDWNLFINDTNIIVEVPIQEIDKDNLEETKTIILKSNTENIKLIENGIITDMRKKGFRNKDIDELKMALDEILINSIEHGNKFNNEKNIFINYKIVNKKIVIEIEDEGEGFNYQDVEDPLELSERGRGLFIIKKLVDEVEFLNNGKKIIIIKETD